MRTDNRKHNLNTNGDNPDKALIINGALYQLECLSHEATEDEMTSYLLGMLRVHYVSLGFLETHEAK